MAELTNSSETGRNGVAIKTYATDEAGMMADAKSYAKQDFRSVLDTMKKVGIKISGPMDLEPEEGSITEEVVAKALTLVKLGQIKDARLNRVSYFD